MSRTTSFNSFAKGWLAIALFAIAAFVLASPAMAQGQTTAQTTADLNQRSGPGPSYTAFAVIPNGRTVDVYECTATQTWCQVYYNNRLGWVSATYLRFVGGGAVSGPEEPTTVPPVATGGQVQAQATTTLNMREGPGTNYRSVGTLPSGGIITLTRCTQGYVWCEGIYGGRTGWVSAQYLRSVTTQQPIPNVGAQIGLRLFEFILGQAGVQLPPQPRVPGTGEVCLYAEFDYGGAVTCARMGQSVATLDATWDNAISSVRIGAGAWVELCTNAYFGGTCRVVTTDTARLTTVVNDRISSYRTVQGGAIPTPTPTGRACFYSDFNYGGAGFCLNVNDTLSFVGNDWNERISSIRIDPGVTVQVCADQNFGGWCEQYTQNVAQLPPSRNDGISSIRVR